MHPAGGEKGGKHSYEVISRLTQLEIGDVALDSRAGASTGCDLHAVTNPRGQAGDGDEDGEGGAVHRAVDVVAALVPQTPDLPETHTEG